MTDCEINEYEMKETKLEKLISPDLDYGGKDRTVKKEFST